MSKRNEPDDPTASSPTETGKKPRLDIEEQIRRASTLAVQLRDGVKDCTDSKTYAANQIATEELVRIFESLQEKTVDTSESVNSLIKAQVKLEVQRTMNALCTRFDKLPSSQRYQINNILKPSTASQREYITQEVQRVMEFVKSGDYAAIIKVAVKEALVKEYKEGSGAELSRVLDTIE